MATNRSVFAELLKRQSILRSATNVALSRLRLPLPPRARMLDAGGPTTTSLDSIAFSGTHRRIAVNIDPARRPHVVADLDRPWPFAEASLDAVVSFFVLEHLRRPHLFFEESFRCLREGGALLLTTVLMHPKHASPHDYFRFTDDCLVALSREAGFRDSRALPILDGPMQSLCAMASSWLVFSVARYLALASSRAVDLVLATAFPEIARAWCTGYIFVATKGPFDRTL